jgi:hypothetical protein
MGITGRLTPMQGWVRAHLLAGIAGAVIGAVAARHTWGTLFPDSVAGFFLYLGAVLLLAALPAVMYQAWALAPAASPLRWLCLTAILLAAAPALLMAVVLPILSLAVAALDVREDRVVWYIYGAAGFLIGALGAALQWVAVKGRIGFLRWWKAAGPALGAAGVVTVIGFGWAILGGLLWHLSIPLACLVYAVGTLPVISRLLRPDPVAATR